LQNHRVLQESVALVGPAARQNDLGLS